MIKNFYKKILNTFFLNSQEEFFVKNHPKIEKPSKVKKKVLLNATEDYKSLCFFSSLKKNSHFDNAEFIFFLPLLSWHRYNHKRNILIFIFKFYLNLIILFYRNLKWRKIYGNLGVDFISLNNKKIFDEIRYLNKAEIILSKIKSKKDLQKLKIKNILVGDLIYDTYLRYNYKSTVDLKDSFLIEVIAKTICSLEKLEKNEIDFDEFFTNQLAYIYHGLLIRKLNKRTKIFNFMWTAGTYYAPLSKYFYLHDFTKYKKLFKKEKNSSDKLLKAEKLLNKKFSGEIIPQENFMPMSPYQKKRYKISNIHGIIFLHCFVDSPTSRGKCIFIDFNDWIIKTLEYFKKKKISDKIAIKPHPDSKEASLVFVEKLKKEYPEFIWLNKDSSNRSIIKKKPKFGITVMGTVLHELAYHNILPISAGENSTLNYKFVMTANSKKQYFDLIEKSLNDKISYKPKKKEILEWVYMTYLYDKNNEDLFCKKIKLKDWNFKKKDILKKYINLLN